MYFVYICVLTKVVSHYDLSLEWFYLGFVLTLQSLLMLMTEWSMIPVGEACDITSSSLMSLSV